jgi:hypothetical protein
MFTTRRNEAAFFLLRSIIVVTILLPFFIRPSSSVAAPKYNPFSYSVSGGNLITFTITGSLNVGRNGYPVSLLDNGKVLVSGGRIGDTYFRSAELYDTKTGSWTLTGSMTVSRTLHSSTLLSNGLVLIAGGQSYAGDFIYFASAELYDPVTGVFTTTGSMSKARNGHTATRLCDGRVLVIGGNRNDDSAELYDPTNGTFTTTGSMNIAREAYSVTLLQNGKVLVVGGFSGGTYVASAELYDPVTEIWTLTGSMSVIRSDSSATLLGDGRVLVAGGVDRSVFMGDPIASAELYDPNTGTFSPTSSMNAPRAFHTATLLNTGQVLVTGGAGYSPLASAELYDPNTGEWNTTGSMTVTRAEHTATLLKNGQVLIVGNGPGNTSAEIATGVTDNDVPTGSVLVNGGALSTAAISVTLSLSATDTSGVVTVMSFSNDGNTWSEWQFFKSHSNWSLTSDDGIKTVYARFRDLAGNISLPFSDTIALDTTVETEYGMTINDGAVFCNTTSVTLIIGARPGTTQMQVSNDGGFALAQWEPYSSRKAWVITQYGNYVIPRVVYIRYKDPNGVISSHYQDDIILDVTPPTGSVSIGSTNGPRVAASSVTLVLNATDDVSGVGSMMISNNASFSEAVWEPYATSRTWELGYNTDVYVLYRDNASNVSDTYFTGTWQVFLPLSSK